MEYHSHPDTEQYYEPNHWSRASAQTAWTQTTTGHSAGHNQSDITRSEDNHFFTGHKAFHVSNRWPYRQWRRQKDGIQELHHPYDLSYSFICRCTLLFWSTTVISFSSLMTWMDLRSPLSCISSTMVSSIRDERHPIFLMKRFVLAGPHFQKCRKPKPLWIHWLRIPPSSRSSPRIRTFSAPPFLASNLGRG